MIIIEYHRLTHYEEFSAGSHSLCKYVYGHTDIFFPHCHEFYEIFLIVKGTVEHWVKGQVQLLPEGSLVFIRPNDTHGFLYINPENANNIYINLSFSTEVAEALFEFLSDEHIENNILSSQMPPTVILSKNTKDRLISTLNELNAINQKDKREHDLRVKAILADILIRYFLDNLQDGDNGSPQWLSHLLKEMEQIDNFTAGMDRMISLSGKSREHLSRCLKKHNGTTVTEFINSQRINYAANLLINSNLSVVEICYSCGFQNLGYFYKIFKKEYNTTPYLFKKQYSKIGF